MLVYVLDYIHVGLFYWLYIVVVRHELSIERELIELLGWLNVILRWFLGRLCEEEIRVISIYILSGCGCVCTYWGLILVFDVLIWMCITHGLITITLGVKAWTWLGIRGWIYKGGYYVNEIKLVWKILLRRRYLERIVWMRYSILLFIDCNEH